ncbi:hypothetical protein PN498_28380 [Oscillatoria sp. CS-180]|uniref:hypothetical protein n=1 Tax=Oscillatoria sp. CS-180 TaxID=3021720 RepID=UPI00232F38AA|nr:hypothetical protein [Oscillatoria sp. CS-180]MDB9529937.1 hypothetical protein [Oscillatoria sp. CS-180]
MKRLIPYVLSGLAIASVATAQTTPPPELPSEPLQPSDTDSPKRLTITVFVADPEDLKVQQGDRVSAGQLIADRTRERQRLETQYQQLTLTLQKLQASTITPPQAPASVPAIAALPHPNYLEEQATIERAKVTVEQAEAAIAAKQQELTYLAELPNLNPLVLEHETAKLAELQRAHTAAVRDYQLSMGKLANAQSDTDYQEYRHSLDLAERVERANQAALSYQRQWAEYEQRLRDRDYQLSQTQLRLDEVENAIASLAVVRSPYAGRIRQIKWLGQGADGLLSVELTLLVRDGHPTDDAPNLTPPPQLPNAPSLPAPVSGQQRGMPDDADGASDREQSRD